MMLMIGVYPAFAHVPTAPLAPGLNQLLVRATESGDLAEMRHLLDEGADPNFRGTNAFHYPLLLIAAIGGHPEAVTLLLKRGANPEASDIRRTPILVSAAALSTGSSTALNESIRILLTRGHANPDARDRAQIGDGRSALHLAAANGSMELVAILIAAGADPNGKNRVGETALHFAAAHGHLETARYLLAHGARLNSRSRYTRMTPVMAAAESGQPEVVKLLIERRANVNERNTFGDTPLTMARGRGRRVIDPRIRTQYRETIRVLELASRGG
jgi:ankyrin repeat protein